MSMQPQKPSDFKVSRGRGRHLFVQLQQAQNVFFLCSSYYRVMVLRPQHLQSSTCVWALTNGISVSDDVPCNQSGGSGRWLYRLGTCRGNSQVNKLRENTNICCSRAAAESGVENPAQAVFIGVLI